MNRQSASSQPIERRALQAAVALFALIPISAGIAGIIAGPSMIISGASDISLDSHFRYLSGLLLAVGFGFWSTLPSIEKRSSRFLTLTLIVFTGGIARLIGLIFIGTPSLPMLGGLIMELFVTPLLCLWQFRVARAVCAKKI